MTAPAAAPAPAAVRFGALRSRRFAIFWTGLLISHTGTWMQIVGTGWLVYQLTNTPVWLGLASLAFAVPMTVLPIVGGALADRVDRIALMRNLQLCAAAAAGVLAWVIAAGLVRAWHLVAFGLVQGAVLAFDGPARHATVPNLVDRAHLLGAVSLAQSTYQIGGFFGPALAGVLLGALGTGRLAVLFAVNAATFLIFAGALALLRDVRQEPSRAQSLAGSLVEGVGFVWSRPALRALLVLITIAGVFGRSYVALLPVFARDVLGTDARGLGFLTAAPGVGVIAAAAVLSASGGVRRRAPVIVGAAALFAILLAAFAASRVWALSLAVLAALGFTTMVLVATMSATMQLAAPDSLRGRVMSLWAVANVGLPSLGAMITAGAAAAVGAPAAVGAGAAVVLGATLVLAPRLTRLD